MFPRLKLRKYESFVRNCAYEFSSLRSPNRRPPFQAYSKCNSYSTRYFMRSPVFLQRSITRTFSSEQHDDDNKRKAAAAWTSRFRDSSVKKDLLTMGEKAKLQPVDDADNKKPSLLARFKQMYRDYWYVLVPVHLVTSIVWFGSFYYMASSGIDIASILDSLGVAEGIVTKIRNGANTTAGYLAISYALYKIATPLRYTVTLGGTTLSINHLKNWGYIKPIPPKEELKKMYKEQKENLKIYGNPKKVFSGEAYDRLIKSMKDRKEKRLKNNKK